MLSPSLLGDPLQTIDMLYISRLVKKAILQKDNERDEPTRPWTTGQGYPSVSRESMIRKSLNLGDASRSGEESDL